MELRLQGLSLVQVGFCLSGFYAIVFLQFQFHLCMHVTHGSNCCHSYFFFIGSSLFGNKGQTAFGGTSFNQPQSSATTGLFGGTSTNTGGSLFGGATSGSIFGQQPAAQRKLEI